MRSAGGTCSLREAINFGNLLAGFGTSGPDITFAPALFASATTASPATITLGASLPNITGPIDIAGPGANLLVVSGANQFQVGTITSSGSLALNGTTLTQGNESTPNIGQVGSGGTLFTEGLLTLSSSAITAGSTLGNGGAIFGYNNAVIALSGSTLSGNTANSGGGAIYLQGLALQISNSTINGNTAYLGGALEVLSGTLTIVGSTISGNSAVQYSGVADRENDSNYLANDIIEGNSEDENESDVESSYTDGGGNLIGTSQNVVDPGLAPLAYNGGSTQTMLPLPGSPAICAGTPANRVAFNLSTDQRGATHSLAYCASTQADSGAVQTSYSALAFVQQPTNTLVNAAITPSPTLTVAEDGTNADNIPIPLTLSSGNANAILAGTTTQTSVLGGAATFSGLSVTAPSTMNTLDALLNITPTGYAGKSYALSATSSNFIVEPLTAQLAYANPPAGALGAGGRVSYVTVDEEDANGNIVTTASDTITLSVISTGGYSATYMAQAINGVATFNLSSAAFAPGNYTYTASYSTVTPAIAMETVTKGTPAITVANSSIPYGTASTILTANLAYSGPPPTGAVTFQVDSGAIVPATCTGASSPLSCSATYTTSSLNAGGHTITVTDGADQNYNTASGSGTLTITSVAATITFSTAATYSYGQSFQLAATSNSPGAFTYSLASGPAVVTVAGAVAVTGEGTVVLQASEAAAGGYTAGLKQASFNAIKTSSTTALAAIIVKSATARLLRSR